MFFGRLSIVSVRLRTSYSNFVTLLQDIERCVSCSPYLENAGVFFTLKTPVEPNYSNVLICATLSVHGTTKSPKFGQVLHDVVSEVVNESLFIYSSARDTEEDRLGHYSGWIGLMPLLIRKQCFWLSHGLKEMSNIVPPLNLFVGKYDNKKAYRSLECNFANSLPSSGLTKSTFYCTPVLTDRAYYAVTKYTGVEFCVIPQQNRTYVTNSAALGDTYLRALLRELTLDRPLTSCFWVSMCPQSLSTHYSPAGVTQEEKFTNVYLQFHGKFLNTNVACLMVLLKGPHEASPRVARKRETAERKSTAYVNATRSATQEPKSSMLCFNTALGKGTKRPPGLCCPEKHSGVKPPDFYSQDYIRDYAQNISVSCVDGVSSRAEWDETKLCQQYHVEHIVDKEPGTEDQEECESGVFETEFVPCEHVVQPVVLPKIYNLVWY